MARINVDFYSFSFNSTWARACVFFVAGSPFDKKIEKKIVFVFHFSTLYGE